MNERWKVISLCPEYEVSSLGRVRRVGRAKGAKAGRVKVPAPSQAGYPVVHLSSGGNRSVHFVHRLVAEAFIGPCPEGREANHKDGNKQNPSADNLEYVTRSENARHALETGLKIPLCGEAAPSAVLTAEQVISIREDAATMSYPAIARKHGIDRARVSRICRGELWPSAGGPIWPRRRHGNNQHQVRIAARPVSVAA